MHVLKNHIEKNGKQWFFILALAIPIPASHMPGSVTFQSCFSYWFLLQFQIMCFYHYFFIYLLLTLSIDYGVKMKGYLTLLGCPLLTCPHPPNIVISLFLFNPQAVVHIIMTQ